MYNFFGMVLASMILELRKEVLAHFLQGNKMRMRIILKKDCEKTKESLIREFRIIGKFSIEKAF